MIPASVLHACTAVMLRAKDGSAVLARTQEWGAFDLDSEITVVSRQTSFTGTTPGKRPGLKWKVKFGYVGIVGLTEKVMIDGMNEKGLACAVLYLPGYAKFPKYDPAKASSTIAAHDLPHWILSQLTTVDEVKQKLPAVNVAPVKVKGLGNIVPPIHFMITDCSGQTIVVEYTKGTLHIYDNPVGVMTNAPEFPWHLTNLNNYVGLTPGARSSMQVGELRIETVSVRSRHENAGTSWRLHASVSLRSRRRIAEHGSPAVQRS